MNAPTAKADWHEFPSADALAEALAGDVAQALAAAIERRGMGFLAVSGGSTPGRFFAALSQRKIDWSRVTVTLVDERCVPETSPRSNAALVREKLLTGEAAAARFVGLFRDRATVEDAAAAAARDLAALPWPLDVAILGMGADGHTASFFPDAAGLDALLDPASDALVLPVHAASAGEQRLTLPLSRLLAARLLALHIEGGEKRTVLEKALEPGGERPVSAVFRHSNAPVPVYWAG